MTKTKSHKINFVTQKGWKKMKKGGIQPKSWAFQALIETQNFFVIQKMQNFYKVFRITTLQSWIEK